MKKTISGMLALMMSAAMPLSAFAEGTMHSELLDKLNQGAANIVASESQTVNMYQNMVWSASTFSAAPSAFDLRSYGVVPEIRNQGNWGTCWGFAAIAASEISILSKMGLTADEFQALFEEEMNLSEKHLAWFGTGHLPEVSDYAEGEYPYPEIISQAGEGVYQRDAEQGQYARYNNGGYAAYASSVFAAGIGPRFENEFPYAASDGTSSTAADWTLPDSDRFGVTFELENSHMLPAPASVDADGNYVYNAWGTAAIKDELLKGRAVSISYHADQAMDPEATFNLYIDAFSETCELSLSESDKALLKSILSDSSSFSTDNLSEEEQVLVGTFFAFILSISENMTNEDIQQISDDLSDNLLDGLSDDLKEQLLARMDDPDNADAEDFARAAAEMLGMDYDAYKESLDVAIAANEIVYINTDTYAQYTDDINAPRTHAVTIIGWDDDYAVENFPADHQPPAAGAWIVRNSWGKGYGNDGYFYLSYYDQTIATPESFDFVVSGSRMNTSSVSIMGYDYMVADSIGSVQMDEGTATANIFTTSEDIVLSDVSILTADGNTNVTLAVYLLNDDAKSPVDGIMLDTITQTILYAGYHRIELNQNYVIPAGSKISVVQAQRVYADDKTVYAVPYTNATNEKLMEMQNVIETNSDYRISFWSEARIGEGESFVRLDNDEWVDWKDIVSELQSTSEAATYLSYDNLNLKLYAYSLDEIKDTHLFGEKTPYLGMEAEICGDCGYTLIEP